MADDLPPSFTPPQAAQAAPIAAPTAAPPAQAASKAQPAEPEEAAWKTVGKAVLRGAKRTSEALLGEDMPALHYDPETKKIQQGVRDPETGAITYSSQPPPQAKKQQTGDERGWYARTRDTLESRKFWLSDLPEFAGELAGGGPGGLAQAGRRASGGLLARATDAAIESRAGRALDIGGGERGMVPFQQGSLEEARAADQASRAAGTGSRAARISANIPGGGPARAAVARADTRAAGLTADEIARNLLGGQERVISTEREAYGAFNNADRAQIAAFWRAGGPDQVWEALRDPQTAEILQRATGVLSRGSRRYLASEMLSRMGRDAAGGAFNADTFMRNWQAMVPEARDTIFGQRALGTTYARDMTELVTNVEQIQAYARTSPTVALARRIPHRGAAGIATAAGAAGGAVLIGVENVLHALMSPVPYGLAATAVGVNYSLAHALTNPATVRWLAKRSAQMLIPYEAQQHDWLSTMPSSSDQRRSYEPSQTPR